MEAGETTGREEKSTFITKKERTEDEEKEQQKMGSWRMIMRCYDVQGSLFFFYPFLLQLSPLEKEAKTWNNKEKREERKKGE